MRGQWFAIIKKLLSGNIGRLVQFILIKVAVNLFALSIHVLITQPSLHTLVK